MNVFQHPDAAPYYRRDLALIHHRAFGFHAEMCAPGILHLLRPVLERRGLVIELGCGSGLLTRYLVDAGHRVVATDASPAMLDLARKYVPAAEIALLNLPDDPIPASDAVVSVGHVLSYLENEAAVERALTAAARSVRPGGLIAIDLCDLEWGRERQGALPAAWVGEDWALITEFSVPTPTRFVRQMAIFMRGEDENSWRRDDERHENVLYDTARVPSILGAEGLEASVGRSFGNEELPVGLRTIIAYRRA